MKDYTKYIENFSEIGFQYGIKFIGAIAIFLIGKWIAGKIVLLIKKTMGKANVEPTLISFVGHTTYIFLIIAILVAVASNLGVNTTSFVAIFGAAGLAIGLALKDTLSNVGAAVLLIFFRPFKVGDFIEVTGVTGYVKCLNLFSTTLNTTDNRSIVIPNGTLIAGHIINYTGNENRRIDMIFDVSYKEDIQIVKNLIIQILDNHPNVLIEPKSVVAIGDLTASSVQFVVRPWVNVELYWDTKFEITEQIKLAFDENNISIPFPQMDIHLKK